MTDTGGLRAKAVQGAVWSGFSSIVLRAGSLVVGIVLARLLTPDQFGAFAVALTVQTILMTVADLGLSADLVRTEEPERIAPTIASLALICGTITSVTTMLASPWLARLLGSAEATSAIAILSLTLFLAGVSMVPYAMLLRGFQQRELFWIGCADFVVYTAVTLTLVGLGFGIVGMAIGRVAAQTIASALQFAFARIRPKFAIDRTILRPVLAYSLPIAAANLIAWALLNVDNVVLARMAGVTALGYYVLAFNIASWPMNALSQVVRSIALPYFSRSDEASDDLAKVTAVGWALSLPVSGLLAALSAPLIEVVYGTKWLPAAPVLAAFGIYGALRVVLDVATGFLYSRGSSRPVLWIQIIWLLALIGGMVWVTPRFGIAGAAWVHVVVTVVVIAPAYLVALRRSGVRVGGLARSMLWPTVAAGPAIAAAIVIGTTLTDPLIALLLGGAVASLLYLAIMWRWVQREVRQLRALN